MRKKLALGNWKMNGETEANARLLNVLRDNEPISDDAIVGVCVPYLYVGHTRDALRGSCVKWGVQDVSAQSEGAYTGEISARMASDFDVSFALVGHSERRTYHGESDVIVASKVLRCIESNITPVICVGETLVERESGNANTVIGQQLSVALSKLSDDQAQNVVVAYEPVWAIGTGRSASPDQVQATHSFLRQALAARSETLKNVAILYGGSVKATSASELFHQPDVDGGLIGSASLDARQFIDIIDALR
ncbi:triosephosphate isomerase [Caballeronia udeis]|uniref:Triosephosphate isomerase n=2 Tax=Caballeronia udeis TaxID=1232866 RepID=A0A158K1U0_9BURK|nr:triose-phosphate isomerase [Caballeronia udeis]SAL74699.1 triosephosphate isomerase [Caballeronia udeis]